MGAALVFTRGEASSFELSSGRVRSLQQAHDDALLRLRSAGDPRSPVIAGNRPSWRPRGGVAMLVGTGGRMTARDVRLQFHGGAGVRRDDAAGQTVGKRTLVQMEAIGAAPQPEQVHQIARTAIAGPAAAMPHGARIQQLFGRHDISGIQAHGDAGAAAGAGAIGAQAFALGNHVAFAGAPSLHTAAHEAAHVVQQRAGVHLKNGVGEVGDAYERHADAVADRVVAGQSAEALLDTMAPGGRTGAGTAAVQCEMTMARIVGQDQILNVTFTDSYFSGLLPLDDPEAAASQEVALTDPFIDAIEALLITPLTAVAYSKPSQLKHGGYTFALEWRAIEQRLYVTQIGLAQPIKRKHKRKLAPERETTKSTSSKDPYATKKHKEEDGEKEKELEPREKPMLDDSLGPYRYGGQVLGGAPKGAVRIAYHYTAPEVVPQIKSSGIVISRELNGTGAAVSGVNQDGEGFYTTTDDNWPYHSPDRAQVKFGVYVHPEALKQLITTQVPSKLSFVTTKWWQDSSQLSRYITEYDIIERDSGESDHKDLKFNPRAVPYLALVMEGQKKADSSYLKLRTQSGFGSSQSTPKPTVSDTLTNEQEQIVTKMFTSDAYQKADGGVRFEMRTKLAGELGVSMRSLLPFREKYEK